MAQALQGNAEDETKSESKDDEEDMALDWWYKTFHRKIDIDFLLKFMYAYLGWHKDFLCRLLP